MTTLIEKAPEGLHNFCENLIVGRFEKRTSILDIATGTGAMSRRLLNRGYGNIIANDINADAFEASEVDFKSVDLNSEFVEHIGHETFDLILAIEIIEHLENPLYFIRQCMQVLKEGGHLLITTPNVLGSESLIQWLKNGNWLYFSPEWYHITGHISILPAWLLDAHVHKNGLRTVYRGFTPRLLKRESNSILRNIFGNFITGFIDLILRCIGKPKTEVQGTNYVVLCRKY